MFFKLEYVVYFFILIISLPFHEFFHAYVANLLGDDTAKISGRLSLNPMRHFNLIGFACLMLLGFGWATPVPVDSSKFKNPRAGMALVAAAGPFSNVLLAFVSLFICKLLIVFSSLRINFLVDDMFLNILIVFLKYFTIVNLNLAVFNLIAIPPLDGSRILFMSCLPYKYYDLMPRLDRYGSGLLLFLLLSGRLNRLIRIASNYMYSFLNGLVHI